MTHPKYRTWLWVILLLAFIIRLLYTFSLDPLIQYNSGGDSGFYLQVGRDWVGGLDYTNIPIPVAPLFLLIVGIPQQILSPANAVYSIFILHSLLLTLCCYFAYRIAVRLSDERAGLVVAGALAFSLSFIVEAGSVQTETVYITLFLLAIWLYLDKFIAIDALQTKHYLWLLLVAVLLGLATLTRPISLLFPVGIAIHLLILRHWRAVIPFLTVYALVTLSWTLYTSLNYNWTVIGSNQFLPAVWRGVVEGDGSPEENDDLLGDDTPAEQITMLIAQSPVDVFQRRVSELIGAYLQPHNTIQFGSVSLRQLALNWINSGLAFEGLRMLVQSEGFLPKLIIYIWHYVGLVGGLVGMWLTRDRWRYTLPLIGFIAYTTLLHFVALALPRYIFPTYAFYWVFAAIALVALWDRVRGNQKQAED